MLQRWYHVHSINDRHDDNDHKKETERKKIFLLFIWCRIRISQRCILISSLLCLQKCSAHSNGICCLIGRVDRDGNKTHTDRKLYRQPLNVTSKVELTF
jgi:hypothetical protein